MHKFSKGFSNKLILWYLQHKRMLPWRKTTLPYQIWLSEIILQQTRVSQGLPYYLKFLEAYPKVSDLAQASETEVLKLWQGLGYYSRARNLRATAKMVSEEMEGVFPNNHKDLMKLKGIGDYTASAIASICFNEAQAVVDGNVYRVLSRIFGISTPINSGAGSKQFKQLAQELIDKEQPGTFNQAIMEFGALYCIPQNPDCENCIFKKSCMAFQENRVAELPVKTKAIPIKKRYFNYLVTISGADRTLIQQRLKKGIWHKLFEFPLIETEFEVDIHSLEKLPQFKTFSKTHSIESVCLFNEKPIVHKLSHQHLYARFWIVYALKDPNSSIPISEINKYPVPVLIENFVAEFFETY
ncbi:MAG TPA: A/G-specific adenine glycosylase [Aequorivita sp.]|nr:A/G-specific adenine glycosylase [Aequorivita sp.]